MNLRTKIVSTVAAAMLVTGVYAAEEEGGRKRGAHRGGNEAGRIERMATRLNLTDAQKQSADALFRESREAAKPIAEQLRAVRQEMHEAVKAGKSEAELSQLANRQGDLMGQLAAVHAKAMAKFYAQLTPEQKAQADQFKGRFRGRMHRSPRPAA